jgi:DNA primase
VTRDECEELIEEFHLDLTWHGSQWRGPCPLHHGTRVSSFALTPGRGFFCFACGEGGSIEEFVARMRGEDPLDVVRPTARKRAEQAGPVTPLTPLDPTHPYFLGRGIHEATAQHFGIGYFRGRPPLGGRIIAPLHDPNGTLVGHIGRAVDDTVEPRYCFQRGVHRRELLFNLHRVKAAGADSVILVEGIFDALAVFQVGFPHVVASLGCRITATQRALLSRFSQVFILFDHDPSGNEAAARLSEELGRAAVRVSLPKADPASLKGVILERLLRTAAA